MEVKLAYTTCRSIDDLSKIIDQVHDLFMDVECICHIQSERKLQLPLFIAPTAETPIALLEFRNVENYRIFDTEKVGRYDINLITFDPRLSSACVVGGVPFKLTVKVAILEIVLTPCPIATS